MSKKETIKDKLRSFEEREKKIKLRLDSDSDEMKDKARRVGKIVLTAGIVAILGYWIFNIIFQNDEDEEEPEKRKKKSKDSSTFFSRITAFAMPYLNKLLDEVLDEGEKETHKKKKSVEREPED